MAIQVDSTQDVAPAELWLTRTREGLLERADSDSLGMLAAIGIIKGQPFMPDAHTREILDQAAKTGYKTSRVIGFEEKVSGKSYRMYSDRRWLNPFADGTPANPTGTLNLACDNVGGVFRDLDARIWMFTNYYSISPGMVSQNPGKGAMYVIGFTDSEGALGGWQQLSPESAGQHPRRTVLVAGALRQPDALDAADRRAVSKHG